MPSLWSLAFQIISSWVGFFVLAQVANPYASSRDKGITAFLYPLAALNLFAVSRLFLDLSALTGTAIPGLQEFSRCVRLTHGLAWTLFCHRHFTLTGVNDFRHKLTVPLIALTALNILAFLAASWAKTGLEPAYRVNLLIMSATAFYAALTAFTLPLRSAAVLPSAWTGIWIAGISLIVYPLAVVSDVFGYRYPLFSGNRLVWEQAFPAYFIVVNALILRLALHDVKAAPTVAVKPALTRREADVLALIAARKAYKEISAELGISMATVKTHASNAYRKLGISGCRELDPTGEESPGIGSNPKSGV